MVEIADEIVIEKARIYKDFWLFITECLGYKENEGLGWVDLVEEHRALCKLLEDRSKRFKLVLMPRYTLKSCICTIGWSLWRMVRNPNIRILIYSDNATKAQGFLEGIKNHILGESSNSRFSELFPHWETDPHGGKWNESQIVIRTRDSAEKEPTVDTGGIESSKIGCHYDLIIFDDIVSDLNVTTKAQMDKVHDCYKKSLSLLKPDGEVIVTGTRWSFGDTYGRIIAENEGEWQVFCKKIEYNGYYPFASIGLTEEFLKFQKKEQGSYLVSCLYYNEPVDPSTALFKAEDFRFYENIDHTNLYKTCCCDPAGEGDDYTAFTVVGTDNNMRMYLLYAKHGKMKPHQIVHEVVKLSYNFKFTKFGIETNLFHGMLEKELNLRLEDERRNPNFKPFGTEIFRSTARAGTGKHARILSLQPYHERGDLVFPGKDVASLQGSYSELATQMLQYTENHRPVHDDLVDSLSFHVSLICRGKVEVQDRPAKDSIAWVLERDRSDYNRMQRRFPSGYRRFQEKFV